MPIEKVYLELTSRCNLNCSMCYRRSWCHLTHDMDKGILDKSLEQIKALPSVKEVVLGGIGEPTFHPEAERVMRALKDKYLILTTNGTIMNESLAKTIVDCVNHVVISVDGMADTFYSIREFPLEQIIENVKLLNEIKIKSTDKTSPSASQYMETMLDKYREMGVDIPPMISFQMVLSKTNKDEVFDVIDLASSLNVAQVILSNILPTSIDSADLILYKLHNNEEMFKFFQRAQNYAYKKGMLLKFPAYELKTERRCRFIEDNTTMITASGDVTPCYRLAHDGKEILFGREKAIYAHSFGNVMEKPLDEIWESRAYTNYRMAVYNNRYPSCTDCDLLDACDMVATSEVDCYGYMPTCADCLWSRKLIYCV
ncbi:MAG: radical SAM protein [Bacillota bacterium]